MLIKNLKSKVIQINEKSNNGDTVSTERANSKKINMCSKKNKQ